MKIVRKPPPPALVPAPPDPLEALVPMLERAAAAQEAAAAQIQDAARVMQKTPEAPARAMRCRCTVTERDEHGRVVSFEVVEIKS